MQIMTKNSSSISQKFLRLVVGSLFVIPHQLRGFIGPDDWYAGLNKLSWNPQVGFSDPYGRRFIL